MGCIDLLLDLPMVIETLSNNRFRVPESARDELPAAKCKLHVVLKGPPPSLGYLLALCFGYHESDGKESREQMWMGC